ncbi:MAG: hypothetical protein GY910_24245 [bacterium]|nr:hypothetical protein [bacterium]
MTNIRRQTRFYQPLRTRWTTRVSSSTRLFGLATTLACSFFGSLSAAADTSESCPTFLPDLRCDRQSRYEGFVAPMSMPYLFEDPFITTEFQGAFVYHEFPANSVFDGGYAAVVAAQIRLAITDRLAFIATKDGLTFLKPDQTLLKNEVGLMDITAGLKYALIDWREKNFILTPSLRYEIPLGKSELFQGKGDGVFIPAATFAWGLGDFHVIGGLGGQIPIDTDRDSTSLFYNLHLDYAIHEYFVPFVEVNGTHWTDSGDGGSGVRTTAGTLSIDTVHAALGLSPFEGGDIANLGSSGIAGTDLITMAWGVRIPLDSHSSIGLSYEKAISRHKGIFDQRVTTMIRYVY